MRFRCNRCQAVVEELGKARHEQGRHQHHIVISERDGSKSNPIGNFDYGKVEWIPVG